MFLWRMFKHWLKWKLAEEELMELERTRVMIQGYWRWNAEFKEVDHVFTEMTNEINQKHNRPLWEERTRNELRAKREEKL